MDGEWQTSSLSIANGQCVQVAWVKSSLSYANGSCVEVADLVWVKSSLSHANGNCVEVADLGRSGLELLRSYADGPRIWDAAAVLPGVHALEEQGLIEPHPERGEQGVYQLTEAGRMMLRAAGRRG